MTTLFTIGHSSHPFAALLALLRRHGVARLVDVRSQPFSRRHPQYRRRQLDALLAECGIEYLFMGDVLGGRPGDEYLLPGGQVDYPRRAAAPDFVAGVARLGTLAADGPTVIMCSEEDPGRCHRRLLVTPSLRELGIEVVHIRGDGRLESEAGAAGDQLPLL